MKGYPVFKTVSYLLCYRASRFPTLVQSLIGLVLLEVFLGMNQSLSK